MQRAKTEQASPGSNWSDLSTQQRTFLAALELLGMLQLGATLTFWRGAILVFDVFSGGDPWPLRLYQYEGYCTNWEQQYSVQ